MPYAPPFDDCANRCPVATPEGDGPTNARRSFGPPRSAPCSAAWTRSTAKPTAARLKPSCPGSWPHCPSCCQPSARPGVPRPPMPPDASWAPVIASIAPRGRFKTRPRPRSMSTSACEVMCSRPFQQKPLRSARADAPCKWRAMTWKRCRCFMCSIGLTPRDCATPSRRDMLWRRELPHPNPSCLLSRFLRAAWGGVCLCASSKAIMRGPRPHGKLEPDFWSRVPSLIRSYRLRECNGLELRTQKIKFQSLTEHIDTETAAGRAMWQMIGVLAELERSLITERTRAGVQAAKQRGVQFGPKPKLTPQQITHARALRAQGEPVPVIAALFKVHRAA